MGRSYGCLQTIGDGTAGAIEAPNEESLNDGSGQKGNVQLSNYIEYIDEILHICNAMKDVHVIVGKGI